MKTKQLLILFALVMLILSACGATRGSEPSASDLPTAEPTMDPNEPVSSDDPTPTPTAVPDPDEVIIRDAVVNSIDILFLESFPLQINVVVRGELGDGCTEAGPITTERQGDTFFVSVKTTRPAEAICTQELRPLEETVSLDVYGLEAGTYTVDVNGVTDTFTLDVDNVLPEEEPTGDVSALTAEDQAEIIRLTLERALVAQEIPDYQLLAEKQPFVLSTENIDSDLVPDIEGLELVLMTPEEIQAKANAEGDFLYLRFSDLSAQSATEATVSLHNNWAIAADSDMAYLSGGGFSIDYEKSDAGWHGEVTSAWIS